MTTTMTITDPAWSLAKLTRAWMDGEPENIAADAANTEAAWTINHIHEYLGAGWIYDAEDGTFSGPYVDNALRAVPALTGEACDFTVDHIEEIRAEYTDA